MCRIFEKTISALANYDSNWHLTATGKIFQTDGVVTIQKYHNTQLSYGADVITLIMLHYRYNCRMPMLCGYKCS